MNTRPRAVVLKSEAFGRKKMAHPIFPDKDFCTLQDELREAKAQVHQRNTVIKGLRDEVAAGQGQGGLLLAAEKRL